MNAQKRAASDRANFERPRKQARMSEENGWVLANYAAEAKSYLLEKGRSYIVNWCKFVSLEVPESLRAQEPLLPRTNPVITPNSSSASISPSSESSGTSSTSKTQSVNFVPNGPPSVQRTGSMPVKLAAYREFKPEGIYEELQEAWSRQMGAKPTLEPMPRRRPVAGAGVKKTSFKREHIHAYKHRQRVQVLKEKQRLTFEEKKREGWVSSYEDFKEWWRYRDQIIKDEIEASPMFRNILSQEQVPRDIEAWRTNPDNYDAIGRAVRKAQETLRSKAPLLPFSPAHDRIGTMFRKKDRRIERRFGRVKSFLPSALPSDADEAVDKAFRKSGFIAKAGKEQVSGQDLARLKPGQWLNDELINFYGQLMLDRAARAEASKENATKQILSIHYFSSFFWVKLKEGYEKARLAKWTKRIDIFKKDVVLLAVNHNNAHWTAAAINFRKKRIESYDSMNIPRNNVYAVLRQYLDDEHRNKKSKPFDFTGWENYGPSDIPQQENQYDCGVFTCQFLESISRGEDDFVFTQKDMPYLRRRMVWDITRSKIDDEPYP